MPNKLHLGCGNNIIKGWINIDISGIADVVTDLRKPLPYPDNSALYIFNEHFIEHLTLEEAYHFLRECYRTLIPKGVLRITTPDLKYLVDCYLSKQTSTWEDVGWTPKTPCQMVNEGITLWGHKFLYDQEELESLLRSAGFSNIAIRSWRRSDHFHLCNLECRPYHNEIIVESTKWK